MEVYYITRNSAGAINKDFLYNYLADKIVTSVDELTDDDKMFLLNEEQSAFYLKYADYVVDDPMAIYNLRTPNLDLINNHIKKVREDKYVSKSDKLYMAYVKYKEFGDETAAAKAYQDWKQAVLEIEEANPYITE